MKDRIKNKFLIVDRNNNSTRRLSQLLLFWSAIIVPFVFAVSIGIYIWLTSDLQYLKGYEGVNNLLSAYSIPLSVLALIFPLVAIIATYHRSSQAQIQIELLQRQNSFANFYKHKDEFEKLVSALEEQHNIIFYDKEEIYRLLFPKNSPAYFDPKYQPRTSDKHFLSVVIDDFLKIRIKIANLLSSENIRISQEQYIGIIYYDICRLSDNLRFKIDSGLLIDEETNCRVLASPQDPLQHSKIVQKLIEAFDRFAMANSDVAKLATWELDIKVWDALKHYVDEKIKKNSGLTYK